MVVCLTGARFTMNAEVLRWHDAPNTGGPDDVAQGEWENYQDPITGEILNRWVPGTLNNPDTPSVDPDDVRTIDCIARGIVDGGIRMTGSNERFGDSYENIELVKLWIPNKVNLAKNDRITNIRAKKGGAVIWQDADGSPTVFNVNGVSPLFDAFNRPIEKFVLLERAD